LFVIVVVLVDGWECEPRIQFLARLLRFAESEVRASKLQMVDGAARFKAIAR
jgi:hypothetical protein